MSSPSRCASTGVADRVLATDGPATADAVPWAHAPSLPAATAATCAQTVPAHLRQNHHLAASIRMGKRANYLSISLARIVSHLIISSYRFRNTDDIRQTRRCSVTAPSPNAHPRTPETQQESCYFTQRVTCPLHCGRSTAIRRQPARGHLHYFTLIQVNALQLLL